MNSIKPSRNSSPKVTIDSVESANAAGLRYVIDTAPGIRRKRNGRCFQYLGASGKVIHDLDTLNRIKSLAVPPAWRQVWICPSSNGHLQATGRDARGRKQYRYHPRWRQARDVSKYDHMIAFARALPKIRRRVRSDLKKRGMGKRKVLATVIKLLEKSLIRVGNEEYARGNHSFGLTTLRTRHVDVSGGRLCFHFRGKGGKEHIVEIQDARLARVVGRCQEIPGQELFQYVDEEGQRRKIESGDVNEYLREISGGDFTAKDFRTWTGTVLAAATLREFSPFHSLAEGRKNVARTIKRVAARLGNTPAICRKCYVHPAVIQAYLEKSRSGRRNAPDGHQSTGRLNPMSQEETRVLAMLQQKVAQQSTGKRLREHLAASLRAERRTRRNQSPRQ